jgi:predicted small secreted protein
MRALALVLVLAALPLLTCCQTARGLADDGQLQQACMAVERAPSPIIDDDSQALAARIRRRLPGTITARVVPHAELVAAAGGAHIGQHPGFVEVVVDGDGVLELRGLSLVDRAGTRLEGAAPTESLALALAGAPPPPSPVAHSSTHHPGALEALIKVIAIAAIGIPLSVGSLGMISPDLGGALDPSATTTSTWTTDHPDLAAWQARPEVVAAARVGQFLGVGRAPCAAGRCRLLVSVARADDVWRQVQLRLLLTTGACRLDDSVIVDVGSQTAFADTAGDDGQWGRFWDQGLGLRPVVDDLGAAADGCAECFGVCSGC